jgi:hypothetical protein
VVAFPTLSDKMLIQSRPIPPVADSPFLKGVDAGAERGPMF